MKTRNLIKAVQNFRKTISIFIFCGFIFISCGSSKKMNFVNNSGTGTIEGKYLNKNKGGNIIYMLDRKLLKDTIDRKIKYENFEISFEKNKRMTFKIYDSVGTVIERDYKYKNRNGIYYLKNKNVKPLLLPFICGALNEKRLYLYKNQNGKLSINVYESNYGAILLIGFLGGHQSSVTTDFQKIEN